MRDAIEIIHRSDQRITAWSGGVTAELAIFPSDADYATRNFGWRISAATVDTDHSIFTALPGMWRHLMVTEGRVVLAHEGHHKVTLSPFEQDTFNGAWRTQSWGRAKDLNVMLAAPYRAEIMAPPSLPDTLEIVTSIRVSRQPAWEMWYCVADSFWVHSVDDFHTKLDVGDLMVIRRHRLKPSLSLAMRVESAFQSQPVGPIRIAIVGPT